MNKKRNVLNADEVLKSDAFNDVADQTPMRVVDTKAEFDYYSNPKPSVADTVTFVQSIINSSRILACEDETIEIAEGLFKQGVVFRHQRKAIKKNATRYSRLEEKARKEMKEQQEQCGNCAECGECH